MPCDACSGWATYDAVQDAGNGGIEGLYVVLGVVAVGSRAHLHYRLADKAAAQRLGARLFVGLCCAQCALDSVDALVFPEHLCELYVQGQNAYLYPLVAFCFTISLSTLGLTFGLKVLLLSLVLLPLLGGVAATRAHGCGYTSAVLVGVGALLLGFLVSHVAEFYARIACAAFPPLTHRRTHKRPLSRRRCCCRD